MTWNSRLFIDPEWTRVLNSQQLTEISSFLKLDIGNLIVQDGGNEVRQFPITGPDGVQTNLFIKKYFTSSREKFWKGFFRGTFFGKSKVRREFENLNTIRAIGLDAPMPVAMGEERTGGRLLNSFIVSIEVPECVGLDDFLLNTLPKLSASAATSARTLLVDNLARLSTDMHRSGFVHRDYFFRNILISGQSLDRFYLIDMPKGRIWPTWLIVNRKDADLATLDAAAPRSFRKTERLRFYLKYRNLSQLNPAAKHAIHRILRAADPQRASQYRRLENVKDHPAAAVHPKKL